MSRPSVPASPATPLWRTLPYRLRQFKRGLQPTVSPHELAVVTALLAPGALALFQRMTVDGQRHGLNVWQSVQQGWLGQSTGPLPTDLATAALLHDVGKVAAAQAGLRINVWWRSLLVLMEIAIPHLLSHLAAADPQAGWRYLLHVHLTHPAIGAEWAAAAGCSPLTCWLIANHQVKAAALGDQAGAQLLALLQWADGQN